MSSSVVRVATLMVLCVHLVHVSSGQLEGALVEKRSGLRYCGRYLVQALQLVCNGVYNGPLVSKKSNGDMIPGDALRPYDPARGDGEGDGLLWMWLLSSPSDVDLPWPQQQRGGAKVPGGYARVSRGVHDECCRNSCTFQQLQMYCGRR